MTGTQAERRYGVEIESGKQLRALQRMEEAYGMQVAEWAQEGMPIEAMGTPSQMEAFRERKGTPVPWNVEEHNEQSVQRSAEAAVDTSPAGDAGVPESVRDVLSSPGQSLDVSIQRAMEERMDDSFGDVRVHAGPAAARACEQIDARAFTVGNHVAFNAGEYDPSSPEGQDVLAHELAHVRQRAEKGIQRQTLDYKTSRLHEFAAESEDAPENLECRPDFFENHLQESINDIERARGPKLTDPLEVQDISRYTYVETDSQTIRVILPNTQKWDERIDPAAVKGWRHIIARHVSNAAEYDWKFEKSDGYPVTPGESATDKAYTTLWSTGLAPDGIKDVIMEAVRRGEAESDDGHKTFVWDVPEGRQAELGAEQITVHAGEDGMIESAYPSGSLAQTAAKSDTP